MRRTMTRKRMVVWPEDGPPPKLLGQPADKPASRAAPADSNASDVSEEALLKRFAGCHWMSGPELTGLAALFRRWDIDGSGEIEVDEFSGMLTDIVRDLFDLVDVDKSGSLNESEVVRLGRLLGQDMTPQELAEVLPNPLPSPVPPHHRLPHCVRIAAECRCVTSLVRRCCVHNRVCAGHVGDEVHRHGPERGRRGE